MTADEMTDRRPHPHTPEPFLASMDPEIAAVLDAVPPMDLRDLDRARRERDELASSARAAWTPNGTVGIDSRTVTAGSGQSIGLRIYRPLARTASGSALVWMHGGGHVMGRVEQDDPFLHQVVDDTGCVVVSVDWRRAPEHPYPAAIEDSYNALAWTAEHADELGVDERRIVIGGASSGGGLAAGLALLARDRGEVRPAAQFLIYPMLDDRGITPSSRAVAHPHLWNAESNTIAWRHYLRGLPDGDVPPYAAPSRATDLSGLPETWLATATLDLFVDENVDYAQRLMHAGVPVELHVYPQAVHGFDLFAPQARVTRRYKRERDAALARLLGRAQHTTAPRTGA
ncbi:alpha/beta hydrolase [Georgenia sp. AZ-5]|uniref:alpha/beta hydrolase n=1 Tax=Georgenia sp. AZ-5 TaxID=3367526 RepID=UPI0037547648